MNYFFNKSIFSVYSLTNISTGLILSLILGAKVRAQETPLFQINDSLFDSVTDLTSSQHLTPDHIGNDHIGVNLIEALNSDLNTENNSNLSTNSSNNYPENIHQENLISPENNPSNSDINLAQNNQSNYENLSACVQPLELDFNVTQLSPDVDPEQLLSKLEDVEPNANPLLFPTQSEEVSTNHIRAITLQQAIELGQQNNQELQVAQLNLERSQWVLQEAIAGRYPTVSFESAFNRNDSSSRELSIKASPFGNGDGDTISTTLTSRINLNYNLYNAGSTEAQVRIAEAQIEFNRLEYEKVKEKVRLDVTTDYYKLQSADADVGIQTQAVENAITSLRDAKLLEEAGLGTKFDVLRSRVDLADAQQKLISAIAQQKVARRQLTQRLSLAQQAEVFAADQILVTKQWSCSLEDSIIKAYRNRSELEQFLTQRTIEENQQIVDDSNIKPEINFFANYDLLGVLDDDLPPTDGFQLGVNLQWTLFDGGKAKARVEQNEIDQDLAETQFTDQRNKIRFEVEEAYYNLQANLQNIQTANESVNLAQESLELARLRFGAGVGTQTDVINSQTDLTRARGNLLRAIVDYNLSLATLERSVSNLPDEYLFNQ